MNINGIETDTIKNLPSTRLKELLLTADGKGKVVKTEALRVLLERAKDVSDE